MPRIWSNRQLCTPLVYLATTAISECTLYLQQYRNSTVNSRPHDNFVLLYTRAFDAMPTPGPWLLYQKLTQWYL